MTAYRPRPVIVSSAVNPLAQPALRALAAREQAAMTARAETPELDTSPAFSGPDERTTNP